MTPRSLPDALSADLDTDSSARPPAGGGRFARTALCRVIFRFKGYYPITDDVGRQAKHILGKGYIKRRSILNADPEYLAQWAGKGERAGPVPVGQPGGRERVDFGFVIGDWHEYDHDKKRVVQRRPTTMGIIHYSKRGIHIVPAEPAAW